MHEFSLLICLSYSSKKKRIQVIYSNINFSLQSFNYV